MKPLTPPPPHLFRCPCHTYLTHPASHTAHATTYAPRVGACISSVGLAANDPNLFQYGMDIYINKFLHVVRPDGTLPSVRWRVGCSSTTAAGVRLKGGGAS